MLEKNQCAGFPGASLDTEISRLAAPAMMANVLGVPGWDAPAVMVNVLGVPGGMSLHAAAQASYVLTYL